MAERLPPGAYDPESLNLLYLPNASEPNGMFSRSDSIKSSYFASYPGIDTSTTIGNQIQSELLDNAINESNKRGISKGVEGKESGPYKDGENGSRSVDNLTQIEAEWIEQFEPGVYVTFVALQDRTRDLKRVRFSRRRFGEHLAETRWSENREKVYEKYNVRGLDNASVSGHTARISEGTFSPSSQI